MLSKSEFDHSSVYSEQQLQDTHKNYFSGPQFSFSCSKEGDVSRKSSGTLEKH